MQPGQFLVNSLSQKNKILGICDEVICISYASDYESILGWYTKKELKQLGYSFFEEPWVPKDSDRIFVVNALGGIPVPHTWNEYSEEAQEFLIKTGNYARTEAEAKLYKQKLIERMGRKEG